MNDALMGLYSLTDDTRDDNLMWCFAAAEVLYFRTASIVPDEMQFSPGAADEPVDEWPTSEIDAFLSDGTITVSDLEEFARYVNTKDDAFRAADKKIPDVSRPCSRAGCAGTYRASGTPHYDADGSAMVDLTCDRVCGMESVAYWTWDDDDPNMPAINTA